MLCFTKEELLLIIDKYLLQHYNNNVHFIPDNIRGIIKKIMAGDMTTEQIDKIHKRYLALTKELEEIEAKKYYSDEPEKYNTIYICTEEYLNGFVEAMQLLDMDMGLLETPDGIYE